MRASGHGLELMAREQGCGAGERVSPAATAPLKGDGADSSDPAADLGWIGWVHVEEVGHRRFPGRDAGIIERHSDLAMEDLELRAIPVFDHFVKRGESGVDKGAQIRTDRFPSLPIGA